MNTASGRHVWAFMSRRLPHPPENSNERLQFYDKVEGLSKYNFSVLFFYDPSQRREYIDIYPSSRKAWSKDLTPGSYDQLERGVGDPTTPWPVTVAFFIDANRDVFEQMDADLPNDELLRERFAGPVATAIKTDGVMVLDQPPMAVAPDLPPRRRLELVQFMGPSVFSAAPSYTLCLYAENFGFKIYMHVIPDEAVIGFNSWVSLEGPIRLTSGPVYEAANQLAKVLRDAPPILNEITYGAGTNKPWTGKNFYHFYRQSSFDSGAVERAPAYEHPTFTEDRTLPAEAEDPLAALHALFITPVRRLTREAPQLKRLPPIRFMYFDGYSEDRTAADLALLPTSTTFDQLAAGLKLTVDGYHIKSLNILDANGDHHPIAGLGDMLRALATGDSEEHLEILVEFDGTLAGAVAGPFADLAAQPPTPRPT